MRLCEFSVWSDSTCFAYTRSQTSCCGLYKYSIRHLDQLCFIFSVYLLKHTLYTVFTLSIRTVFNNVHLFKTSEIFTIILPHINNQKGLSRENAKYIFYISPNNQFTIEITQVRSIVWP